MSSLLFQCPELDQAERPVLDPVQTNVRANSVGTVWPSLCPTMASIQTSRGWYDGSFRCSGVFARNVLSVSETLLKIIETFLDVSSTYSSVFVSSVWRDTR